MTSNGELTQEANQPFKWNLGFVQMLFRMRNLFVPLFDMVESLESHRSLDDEMYALLQILNAWFNVDKWQ